MARYRASIDTTWTPEEAFAYVSDFSTSAEWDPGVVEAERVSAGKVGLGTEFRLVARFLERNTSITYRVFEYKPPRAVTFRGENATVVSQDRITFEPIDTGTRVTYDADLRLKGLLKLADPLLAHAFNRVGDRALAGLREVLRRPAHKTIDAAA
jgi:carbon monoxide dehydrogenase subunit G